LPELSERNNLPYGRYADIANHPQSQDALQLARERFHPADDVALV